METLTFDLPAAHPTDAPPPLARSWALVGVLASGNLEILVEPDTGPGGGRCHVEVQTSALGFGAVWRAVVEDFSARHGSALTGLRFTVHDAGATPAVVTLRLDQALLEFQSAAPGS